MAEDIGLQELVISLSSALVAARRFLDGASVDLAELYRGKGPLGGLPKPRFKLDSVTFDVPYVVQTVQVKSATLPDVTVARDVRLSDRELASLKRGASPAAAEALDDAVRAYTEAKNLLRAASSPTTSAVTNGTTAGTVPGALKLSGAALLELQRGASDASLQKLDALMRDFAEAREALAVLSNERVLSAAPDLRLRIDAEAIRESVDATRHRITLTFKSDDVETIEANGDAFEIPR